MSMHSVRIGMVPSVSNTFSKDFIDVHNASIKNNTDIVIDCQQKATFDGEFEVEIESTLLVW